MPQGICKASHCKLACAVGTLAGWGDEAEQARDVGQMGAGSLQQVRQDERDEATKEGVGRTFEIASLSGKVAELQSAGADACRERGERGHAGLHWSRRYQQDVEASKAEATRLQQQVQLEWAKSEKQLAECGGMQSSLRRLQRRRRIS